MTRNRSKLLVMAQKKKTIKKAKKSGIEKAIRPGERLRLNHLEHEALQHTDELKIRDDKLRRGASKQKLADKEIVKQREELLHVTRVGKLAEFVSSLAHEISQPLTAMLSYTEAAHRMLKDREPQVKEILQYIINDNHRAAEVIRSLRSLLKKGKSSIDTIDINILIDETVLLIKTDVTVRNKSINTRLAKGLPHIHGDRIQLQQVILNLISNSLEAMEGIDDARELLVQTSRKDANTIIVEVKDRGCGIPKENLGKLFTHFFTTKTDGLGMGLSISRSIVETHGGRLNATNNPGRGANFYFTLPLASHG